MLALVTGATGFIGSHLVERLQKQGYQVRALARETSDLSFLQTTEAEIVFGDIRYLNSLRSAAKNVDIIFHAAAKVTPGWGSWQEFYADTVQGTENVLLAGINAGVQRFLHLSTGSIYGKACEGNTPANESTLSQMEFCPDRYYDWSKLQADQLVIDFSTQGKIESTIIRPGAVYGPRDRLFADRVYRHLSYPILVWPGRANPLYSILFVTDVADFAISVATKDQAVGQIYNIAPDKDVGLRDFANTMMQAMGKQKPQISIPYSVGYVFCLLAEQWSELRGVTEMPYLTRSGLQFLAKGMILDGSKATDELGWKSQVSIEEGTKRYVEWRRGQGTH